MTILVTGAAGFIGSALSLRLLEMGYRVLGIDNHSDYYDVGLKESRLARYLNHAGYTHLRVDLVDKESVNEIFASYRPKVVVNLAAQVGVRYSLEHPLAYIESNILGFIHVLEGCRHYGVEHFVYASSSSVYGANTGMPFSVRDNVDHPLSLYAATKKSNELMAHSYSHLYDLPTTGLRFFTVYGPWGRPDMAYFKFARSILAGKAIDVFNFGNHRRDFTYIDDIIEGIIKVIERPASPNPRWNGENPDPGTSKAPWAVYNIGNSTPVHLKAFIRALEKAFGKEAKMNLLGIQPGDVPDTYAEIDDLVQDFGFRPGTNVEDGVARFAEWYRNYYRVEEDGRIEAASGV